MQGWLHSPAAGPARPVELLRRVQNNVIVAHACAQILRRLEGLAQEMAAPAEDAELVLLTRLLQLAVGCRAQLRARRFACPPPDPELLRGFYPALTGTILEVQLRDEDEPAGARRWLSLAAGPPLRGHIETMY